MVSSRNGQRRKAAATKKKAAHSTKNGKPKYQPLTDLPSDQFEVLKQDIGENGLQYPSLKMTRAMFWTAFNDSEPSVNSKSRPIQPR